MIKRSLYLLLFIFAAVPNLLYAQDQSEDQSRLFVVKKSEKNAPDILPLVENTGIKNVILIIGDGTGLAQITTGQYALVGTDGRLHLQTMPVTGLVNTVSSDNLITDSAAGATAYSCGLKTYNGAIGMNAEQKPCKTILELAEQKGLATGLVATSTITHATPASFGAHVVQRSMENEIAADFLNSGADVILGGGRRHFLPQENDASNREDSRNLIEEFAQKGYSYVQNADELKSAENDKILGLFANSAIDYSAGQPSLAEMTGKAIEVLSQSENGFFLMVEGSQIDWGGHENNVDYVIREVKGFDEAVKSALDFAIENGETLVVLTADHETGGMTLQKQHSSGNVMEIQWTTGGHTGIPVPLMAYGPGAAEFMGWRDNTYVGQKIVELLELGEFPVVGN